MGERPDPVIQEPTDAVVRVVLECVGTGQSIAFAVAYQAMDERRAIKSLIRIGEL